ncbi:hypothetical protein POTOM_047936 [Populus tomentosa]|uniref:Uncharacterized protein n=1 Tax=Populus tomentosa TaxID=118781 RepID=A0A8X8C466_POPTO|nr:hypothetical protein POTOM_047936 [Populus tomentosa]
MGHPRSLDDSLGEPSDNFANDNSYGLTLHRSFQWLKIGEPLAEVQTSRTCSLHWGNFAEQLDMVDHREICGDQIIGLSKYASVREDRHAITALSTAMYNLCFLIPFLLHCRVSHIQANGRSLSPAFGVEIVEPSGKFVLEAQVNLLHQGYLKMMDLVPFLVGM